MKVLLALVFASMLGAVATQAYVLLFDGRHLILLCLFVAGSALTTLLTVRAQEWFIHRWAQRADRVPSQRQRRRRSKPSAVEAATNREAGTVKWFSADKGYGFVVRESGEEIFVHHSAIRGGRDGAKTLADGVPVTFVAVERERGLQASAVEAATPRPPA